MTKQTNKKTGKARDRQLLKRIFAAVVLVLFLGWFLLWPLNEFVESPGSADNLKAYVRVKGHPDHRKGSFMITSVYMQQARPVTWVWAKLTPYTTLESAKSVTGGQSGQTFDKVQSFYMQSAINEAIAVAYKAAHKQVSKRYLGIYVLQVQKSSKFRHDVKVGDTITKVDNRHFNHAQGFQKYIAKQKVGSPLSVTYLHNGHVKTATHKLVRIATGHAGIGIILTDNVKVHTKIPVSVHPGQLGGPSGGLMFALQIYGQLTNQNLRHGQKIAGTGTINPDGSVGEIGGIDKKVVAAHKAGAKIFFAPYIKPTKLVEKYEEGHMTNFQMAKKTAKKVAPDMKVVPVSNFNQAVKYLKTHK